MITIFSAGQGASRRTRGPSRSRAHRPDAIHRSCDPAALWPTRLGRTARVALHRVAGHALGWLAGTSVPLRPGIEAERLIARWGELAPDVARSMSARETAGLFDEADAGFWNAVARHIEQRDPTSPKP